MSALGSPNTQDVFSINEDPREYESTEPTTGVGSGSDEPSYDLKPPPPSISHDNAEELALRLFSVDHLDAILRDQTLAARLTTFLGQYRSQYSDALAQYINTKKAVAAIGYANAVAEQISTPPGHPPYQAATLDERFEAKSKHVVEDLVEEALPAYVTHRLTTLVTDSLVKEITGNQAPIMHELVPSLAEVYCVTDPSLPDNPIVYASEGFYNTTQYGRDYVIGRNCRFLQGPKSSNASVRRLIDAITKGQECCETILNYRRDGTPFINLLLLAPLYDNKGQVRYFLGAQVDVSPLIEGGRGLESFSQLLAQDRSESRFGTRPRGDPKEVLGELGELLDDDETNAVRSRTRRSSGGSLTSPKPGHKGGRRILGIEDQAAERAMWPSPNLGPSGRLPGVYQNYLLVRPYPSLRITFTSPALRIPGLLQTKFLDRIGGPPNVRDGVLDSLSSGQKVTAKITWLTGSGAASSGPSLEGKPRWIHCTPLLGSDDKVGVWMIVMVEHEEVTGSLNKHFARTGISNGSQAAGPVSPKYTTSKLYADYLRREGSGKIARSSTPGRAMSPGVGVPPSAREQRDVDRNFSDF
ncbi:hypothetical protein EJ03DRAFT_268026 [Teratosphaeria nubilosa]|uniref:PAC domain-containing protein n=1 Tax=Teratosphaeria nubilosa TaxID=161662 RepID=A0A6G1LFA9_9PEZI|nr:hypothetical protein EJ03DRAFT_268026 [Teratosphaeria nubilosa]